MANINLNYDQMQTEATALRSGQTQITEQLNTLRGRIDNLVTEGFVTESSSGAFHEMYTKFTSGATQTISALDEIAKSLEGVISTFQGTDQGMGNQFKG